MSWRKHCQLFMLQEVLIVEKAKTDPLITLRGKQTPNSTEIPMEPWGRHFTGILNKGDLVFAHHIDKQTKQLCPITRS